MLQRVVLILGFVLLPGLAAAAGDEQAVAAKASSNAAESRHEESYLTGGERHKQSGETVCCRSHDQGDKILDVSAWLGCRGE